MFRRRRFKWTDISDDRFAAEAKRLREKAKLLPPGTVRDALLRRAREAESYSRIREWLGSPSLQPPK
jgi:hypothetical protein